MLFGHDQDDLAELFRQLLRERNPEVLGTIVQRFYRQLRAAAKRALSHTDVPESFYDADDAVTSSVSVILRLVLAGRVSSFTDADDFWHLYRHVLARKVSDAVDRQNAVKRGGPGIAGHTERPGKSAMGTAGAAVTVPPDDLDLFQSGLPSAEVEAIGKETTAHLIGLLQPELRTVVRMRVDGRSIPDIATELGVSTRTVNRMLETVRSVWRSSEFAESFTSPGGRGRGKHASPIGHTAEPDR